MSDRQHLADGNISGHRLAADGRNKRLTRCHFFLGLCRVVKAQGVAGQRNGALCQTLQEISQIVQRLARLGKQRVRFFLAQREIAGFQPVELELQPLQNLILLTDFNRGKRRRETVETLHGQIAFFGNQVVTGIRPGANFVLERQHLLPVCQRRLGLPEQRADIQRLADIAIKPAELAIAECGAVIVQRRPALKPKVGDEFAEKLKARFRAFNALQMGQRLGKPATDLQIFTLLCQCREIAGYSSGHEHLVETIELPQDVHPWFFASQFHPEFTSTPRKGHPLFTAFVKAALKSKVANGDK